MFQVGTSNKKFLTLNLDWIFSRIQEDFFSSKKFRIGSGRLGFFKVQYWNRPKHDFSSKKKNYCKDCMSKWFNFDELIKYWAYLVKLEGIGALIFNFQDFEKLILVKEDYWSPLIRCRPFIPSKMMNLVNIILHIIYNLCDTILLP